MILYRTKIKRIGILVSTFWFVYLWIRLTSLTIATPSNQSNYCNYTRNSDHDILFSCFGCLKIIKFSLLWALTFKCCNLSIRSSFKKIIFISRNCVFIFVIGYFFLCYSCVFSACIKLCICFLNRCFLVSQFSLFTDSISITCSKFWFCALI